MGNEANSNMVMPVGPMYGNGGGFGYGDNGLFWIILFFLFAWGGNGWGNGFGGGNNGTTTVVNDVQRGFDQTAVMNGLSNIQNTLADAEVARCNMQGNLSAQINSAAMGAQINQAATQSSIADLKATTISEACADRNAISMALRDVIDNNNSGVQAILNQMNTDKIDAKNEEINRLRQELDMVSLANSQNLQTGEIINALRMPTPVPAFAVNPPYQYGGCGCNNGYGCGCGA